MLIMFFDGSFDGFIMVLDGWGYQHHHQIADFIIPGRLLGHISRRSEG